MTSIWWENLTSSCKSTITSDMMKACSNWIHLKVLRNISRNVQLPVNGDESNTLYDWFRCGIVRKYVNSWRKSSFVHIFMSFNETTLRVNTHNSMRGQSCAARPLLLEYLSFWTTEFEQKSWCWFWDFEIGFMVFGENDCRDNEWKNRRDDFSGETIEQGIVEWNCCMPCFFPFLCLNRLTHIPCTRKVNCVNQSV
jgi:hypothetical protein